MNRLRQRVYLNDIGPDGEVGIGFDAPTADEWDAADLNREAYRQIIGAPHWPVRSDAGPDSGRVFGQSRTSEGCWASVCQYGLQRGRSPAPQLNQSADEPMVESPLRIIFHGKLHVA